jgi:hypothetical protein
VDVAKAVVNAPSENKNLLMPFEKLNEDLLLLKNSLGPR